MYGPRTGMVEGGSVYEAVLSTGAALAVLASTALANAFAWTIVVRLR